MYILYYHACEEEVCLVPQSHVELASLKYQNYLNEKPYHAEYINIFFIRNGFYCFAVSSNICRFQKIVGCAAATTSNDDDDHNVIMMMIV